MKYPGMTQEQRRILLARATDAVAELEREAVAICPNAANTARFELGLMLVRLGWLLEGVGE